MIGRRYTLVASAILLLALVLGTWAPAMAAGGKGSCSDSCRTSYGACYKKSQDRAKCQSQLQRCLESCIRTQR